MNPLVPINTDEDKWYIPIKRIQAYALNPTNLFFKRKTPSKTDLCEAYILSEYINDWETAKLSFGNRPDWDVEIETATGKVSFEVKTQSKNYDPVYIEIGEYGTQKPKSVPDDNWNQWVKTGLFASDADKYVIFKEQNNNTYNYYELDASFLKQTIDSYLFTDLFASIRDLGKEFILRSNYAPNTSLKDTIDYLKGETYTKNKNGTRYVSSSKLGYTNKNNIFQPYITGIATTTENKNRWNINVLFNLQALIDGGIITKTVLNVNTSLTALDPVLTKYFVGAEIDHYGSPVIDKLKENFNDGKITEDDVIDELDTWNYDVLFDKSYYDDNNNVKYPDMTLDKILRFQFNLLPYFYITSDLDKTLGIEKVGLGYDSDSSSDSSSSSDSDNGLQFLNLISKK